MKLRDINGNAIFEHDVETMKDLVKIAIQQKINLRNADLRNTNLYNADLRNADLRYVDLRNTNLYNADLRNADLRYADLRNTDLYNANLRNADLRNADLRYADLRYADLNGCDLSVFKIVPEGTLVVWKKANDCLIKLIIPKKAKRVNALGSRKCRFEYAIVKEIINIKTGKQVKQVRSHYDFEFIYRVGETVYPDKFDNDVRVEFSHGIHAFITKEEALKHQ